MFKLKQKNKYLGQFKADRQQQKYEKNSQLSSCSGGQREAERGGWWWRSDNLSTSHQTSYRKSWAGHFLPAGSGQDIEPDSGTYSREIDSDSGTKGGEIKPDSGTVGREIESDSGTFGQVTVFMNSVPKIGKFGRAQCAWQSFYFLIIPVNTVRKLVPLTRMFGVQF